jgi:hypothetical protein
MSKTQDQLEFDKARFDWLRKNRIYGWSHRLSSPFRGKNKAQRRRLAAAFSSFGQ